MQGRVGLHLRARAAAGTCQRRRGRFAHDIVPSPQIGASIGHALIRPRQLVGVVAHEHGLPRHRPALVGHIASVAGVAERVEIGDHLHGRRGDAGGVYLRALYILCKYTPPACRW